MKDFNYINNRPCNLNELMEYYYSNKNQLVEKEHLASIARVTIQSLGRIERRRHKNNNETQFLFINNETYGKMEEFYQFYEYNRYIMGNNINKQDNFSSNLSVNNQYLFDKIKDNLKKNNYITDYNQHVEEQIEKNKMLDELIHFILFKIRTHVKYKENFKGIWSLLKSSTIFHNITQYMQDLDNIVQPKLYEIIKKIHVNTLKSEYPNLFTLVYQKPYMLSSIFFVQFPTNIKIGISSEPDKYNKQYEIIVDYSNAKKTKYNFFRLIFNAEKEDFSNEVLKHILWINSTTSTEDFFIKQYTINNILYVPQKKIALEFIKTAISEEIFENILKSYKFQFQSEIDVNSYELFDFFIKHKNKINYTAVDIKFWSVSTQAIQSKYIEQKIEKKTYVTNFNNVKNILCINLFGKTSNANFKNNIYYKNLFIKNQVRNSINYGKYILNKKIINFLKEELEK